MYTMLQEQVRLLNTDWKYLLQRYPKWDLLEDHYKYELEKESMLDIFPHNTKIFRCFDFFDIQQTKVLILGQDPYHGCGQANGLAFAVNENIKYPPSLKNIFKLISNSKSNSTLESWANQGVLLMNTYLSVRESKPGSHKHIWKDFTEWVLTELGKINTNIISVIWGGHAYEVASKSNLLNKKCFISSHPSPLSNYKKYKDFPSFSESNVFENVNSYFIQNNIQSIVW